MSSLLMWLGTALTFSATAYALIALVARARIYTLSNSRAVKLLPVTVLKPLCGLEPRLAENLASLCEQTYPHYQLLFGVRDPHDPAVRVVERLQAIYSHLDIELIVDSRVHGSNFKVSNLINMAEHARHPWLVLADSDIEVQPDYLEKVAAPLADVSVGIVTCLYHGRALDTFWARMGALFIDTWFVPSVRVVSAFGNTSFGFGSTIALRADALVAIGGFEAVRNRLADDFWLGELVRQQGLQTVLSEVEVGTDVVDSSLAELWTHELRWFRTIRTVEPGGFAFLFVTFTVPILAAGLALCHKPWSLAVAAAGLLARVTVQLLRVPRRPWRAAAVDLILLPLRDMLSLAGWTAAYGGSRVRWREQVFDGLASRAPASAPGR